MIETADGGGAAAPVTLKAATDGARRFSSVAYNGGLMFVKRFSRAIVVDLRGLEANDKIPVNLDHDDTRRVGHVTNVHNDGRTLLVEGVVSGAGAAAQEFLTAADREFPWNASIELIVRRFENVAKGKVVVVNGERFEGPVLIARDSLLHGLAMLAKGADRKTSVSLAAGVVVDPQDEPEMERHYALCLEYGIKNPTGMIAHAGYVAEILQATNRTTQDLADDLQLLSMALQVGQPPSMLRNELARNR